MVQLVGALRYKQEVRGFDSRLCHWNFSLTYPSGRTMAVGSTQSLTEMSKVKESRNRPDVAQRVPGGLGSQSSMTCGT